MAHNIHDVNTAIQIAFNVPLTYSFPTGSRYFGDANPDSDYDIVVKVPTAAALSDFIELASTLGFSRSMGSGKGVGIPYLQAWLRNKEYLHKGEPINVNLIVLVRGYEYSLWEECTTAAKVFNISKEHRHTFFSAIINKTNDHLSKLYDI